MNSWSYSSYSSALQCLRKYKLCYIDKIVPEGSQSSDLVFGSAIHSAINSCLTGQDGLATFELYWNSYREKDVEYGRFNWEQFSTIGSGFIRKFAKFHAPKYGLEFAEKRLYAEYRGIRLEGTPDFYGKYDGRSSLRDFKTSSRNYESAKSQVALQLYLYAYLYRSNNPTATIDTLGYTVFNKSTGSIQDLTWDFDEKTMYDMLDNLASYVTIGFNNNSIYPKNYNACLDYNRKCQYWALCHEEKA